MSESEIANILLDIKAVTLSLDPPYTFASGIKSPIYCDNRLLMSYPKERSKVIQAFAEMIGAAKLELDVVAGTATAGIPHAAWLAEKLEVPMVYVRSEAKEHGKHKRVEGLLKKGQRVLVVEDLVSTGKSSISTVAGIRGEGCTVSDIICIFSYEFHKSKIIFEDADVTIHPLCTFSTLIDVAVKRGGYILPQQQKKVLEWARDPEGWEFLEE